jgi:hypothetical protein
MVGWHETDVSAADGSCLNMNVGERRMAEQPTDKRERYVGYSAYCLKLAKVTFDNQSRAMLREMASEWLKLAEQSYETDQP